MPASRPTELAMRQYLLGEASEDERQALEEVYFEDSEVFDDLTALDDALIEAYVDGTMPVEQRDGFERTLAAFPRRQARLFLVRELAARAGRAKAPAESRTPALAAASSRPRRAWVDGGLWQWGLAAATVVLAIWAGYVIRQTSALRAELQEARLARADAERASASRPESRPGPAAPTVPPAGNPDAPRATSAPAAPAIPIVALTLTPGLLRDAAIPVVTLSKDTLLARVILVLAAPGAPQYTVRLLSSAGAERWRESGVTPSRVGMRAAVTIDLPARVLTGGEFVLEVSTGGESDRPESYHFRATLR
jgi:hypothetical protein